MLKLQSSERTFCNFFFLNRIVTRTGRRRREGVGVGWGVEQFVCRKYKSGDGWRMEVVVGTMERRWLQGLVEWERRGERNVPV